MDESKPRIALFVDYEDICFALKGSDPNFPRPADVIRPITEEFFTENDLVSRIAYADWRKFPKDAVDLVDKLGFKPAFSLASDEPQNVPEDGFGRHPAVPVGLALDALYMALTNEAIDRVVLAGGDRQYYEVVNKLRESGVDVSFLAFERSIPDELAEMAGVETIILENILGPPKSSGPEPEQRIDWAPFIRLLLSMELRYGYVGYRGLKDKLDNRVGCGPSEQDKRNFMDKATQQEIITLEKTTNPKNPEFPLTVCRLNRKNPAVQSILKNSLKISD